MRGFMCTLRWSVGLAVSVTTAGENSQALYFTSFILYNNGVSGFCNFLQNC